LTNTFDFDLAINREGTNSLKYEARQTLFGRADVVPMWVADMDFATPPAVTQALIKRAKSPIYGYTDFPDSIYDALIVPSLHAAVMAYAEPNQSVIVQPPVYFPFFSAVTNTGRQLIKNTLVLENNRYSIDFDHLEQCAKNARMLLLCSPHNPVGRVWQQDELKQILSIAQKHDLVILSDEIHADLIYPEYTHHMLATLAEDTHNIITAIAPSKTFNIPGLGLSALVIPNATHRAAINKAFDLMHVSAANPFSIAAFEAAYNEGGPWLDALLAYLTKTRDYIADYLKTHLPQIKLIAPEGTYLAWLDCRAMNMSDHALKHFFIHKAGLGLSPGTLFGEAGSGFMRMNIGAPKHVIVGALANISQALTK
jgi:cysteine-S-conjugate beta-lyase